MIAAIGAHGASYSITIPHNAKVKAAIAAIDDDAWQAIAYTRGGEAQVAETTIEPGRRGDKLRGDDGEAAEAAAHRAPQPPARRPRRAVAQLALPLLRHRQRRPRHQSRRRLPPRPRHRRARHQRPQREAPGSAAAPQDGSSPTAPGSPAACSRTTSCAGPPASAAPTPQRQLTVAATIRNRLLTVPGRLVNHSGRRKLRLPSQWPWATAFTTALGRHPQPAPTHLSRPQRPAQRSPTPPATNPHRPRTPAPHAPTPTQHTRAPTPASTNPKTAPTLTAPVDSG